jgi:hypothetical protein
MPVKTRSQENLNSTTTRQPRAEKHKRGVGGVVARVQQSRTPNTKRAASQNSPPTTPVSQTANPPCTPASGKSNTSSSPRSEINPEIQKELCEDIESEGGIDLFIGNDHRLAKVLDTLIAVDPLKRELYGSSGGENTKNHRNRIRQKVLRWQHLHKQGKYDKKVLSRFGIVAAKHRKQPTLQEQEEHESIVSNSFSKLSLRDSDSSSQASGNSKKSSSSSSESSSPGSFFPSPEVPARPPPERITTVAMDDDDIKPTPIMVNTEVPWKNGPFIITPVKDIEGTDGMSYFNGFAIFLKINPLWMTESKHEEEYFEARVLHDKNGKNIVLVKAPVADFVILNETEKFEDQTALSSRLSNALFNMQNDYAEQREENNGRDLFQLFALQFPHEYELSSSVINDDAGKNEELTFSIDQVSNDCAHADIEFNNKDTWIVWEVARVDVRAEKKTKREKKQSKGLSAIKKKGTRMSGQSP